ncbi:ribosomal protein S18-alanine N-acetyltransferase [Fusobacterium sp. oral taxon C10]
MIKKLTSNDIDYIEQIFNLEKEIFKSSAFSKSYLNTLIKGDNSFIYVYLIDDKVCGYLLILDSIDVYEILAIATIEEYRNKGIAQELLDKIKTKDIFLEVRESNQVAINFYKKNRFKEISIRKNYYSEPTENAVIMKLEVNVNNE